MARAILTGFLICMFSIPTVASAQSRDAFIQAQINALLEQIKELQILLIAARQEEVRVEREAEQREQAVVASNRRDAFTDFVEGVYGKELLARYVSDIELFRDSDAEFDAYVSPSGNGMYTLSVNRSMFDLSRSSERILLREVLIHELAHMLISDEPGMYGEYVNRFWTESDQAHAARVAELSGNRQFAVTSDYYAQNRSRFVSDYATVSPEEDIAETFAAWVLGEYGGSRVIQDKMGFIISKQSFRRAAEQL